MSDAETNPTRTLSDWLAAFFAGLARSDETVAETLFADVCYWRDLLAFTWNIKTLEGRTAIRAMLAARLSETQPGLWRVDGEAAASADGVEGWFTFETSIGRGKGHARLRDGRCWTLFTAMTELKGFEEKAGLTREKGTQHGAFKNRSTWLDRKTQEESELGYTSQPYVLIIGGGQGGIGLAARLRRLDVPTIVIDKHARAGDSWRKRYKSLCLHDPVWYDHMPYLPFPDHWPVYTPKDKMGDWLEMYAKVMELNYWSSTECESAAWDESAGEWVVSVIRAGGRLTLRPKQLVLATGMSGVPNVPRIPGTESFLGDLHHSSSHSGGEAYRGKRCVVLGSNNSAHDICADLWENDSDVTMIQRSSTMVVRSETLADLGTRGLYSESAVKRGITAEMADLIGAATPYALLGPLGVPVCEKIQARDAAFYARLRQAGFMLDFGDDNSGLSMKYLRRGSGYYIDVGASDLIADGQIKLRSGVTIAEIRPRSVVLNDGTELPADLIVYATGFGSMNGWAARLISQEVADRVGRCWGLGSGTTKDPGPWEGELRNMWKPTRQQGLWFHGGNLAQSRFYSRFLALQLKARCEGISTPVYGMEEVHHP